MLPPAFGVFSINIPEKKKHMNIIRKKFEIFSGWTNHGKIKKKKMVPNHQHDYQISNT